MSQAEVEDLLKRGRITEALAIAERWQASEPASLLALQYQGLTRLFHGDAGAAETSFRQALAMAPEVPRNSANLAIALLSQGRYSEGFLLYESRYAPGISPGDRVSFPGLLPERQWRGEALSGKRLLLVREQGFGDQIQLMRFVPQLRESGAVRVIATVSQGLELLLSSVAGLDLATSADIYAEDYDLWCPLMSLPLLLNLQAPQAPATLPYLHVPESRSLVWRRLLEEWAPGKRRLGVVWAGSPGNSVDARRSLSTEQMLAMLHHRNGAAAISLQMGSAGMNRIEQQCRDGIIPLLDMLKDFTDTAAIIEQLDLVISVDTAVAHLAGALNKPVWLLLPVGADWRWGQHGDSTPWYPSMRIFRQLRAGEWDEVVRAVADAIKSW